MENASGATIFNQDFKIITAGTTADTPKKE